MCEPPLPQDDGSSINGFATCCSTCRLLPPDEGEQLAPRVRSLLLTRVPAIYAEKVPDKPHKPAQPTTRWDSQRRVLENSEQHNPFSLQAFILSTAVALNETAQKWKAQLGAQGMSC